jgi:cytochrome c2
MRIRFHLRACSHVLTLAISVAACTGDRPAARSQESALLQPAAASQSADSLRTPIVTDSGVSFVVPVRECIAPTAADSTTRVQLGARLFSAKGCTRCHQLDAGYADGPDLRGVTQRRTCEWVVALLTDTENMIQTDPDLQQLRVEHFLDMPDHDLSVVEARALFAYLRVAAGH